MSLNLQWLTKDAAEIVAKTRALCYAPAPKEIPEYQKRLAEDVRVTGDDLLLAQHEGCAVGTATSYSMTMRIRGQSFPCQGVAWVGTVKTHRRSLGVATSSVAPANSSGVSGSCWNSLVSPTRAALSAKACSPARGS